MRLNKKIVFTFAFAVVCAVCLAQNTVDTKMIEGGGAGSYKAFATYNDSFPGYSVYRPINMEAAVQKTTLPLVVFTNGDSACSLTKFDNFLNEIASFGYVVVAIGPFVGENDETYDEISTRQSVEMLLKAAIDKMEKCVKDPQSDFYQMVDMKHIAYLGYSDGSSDVLRSADDPRVTTAICLNGGMKGDKSILKTLTTPILYLLGGPSDVAYKNAMDDYERISSAFVAVGEYPYGPDGTYTEPFGGSFAQLATQWLQWQLKERPWDRAIFTGEECICVYSGWEMIQQNKNLLNL